MQLKIYSIRDAKAGIFNKPFYAITHADAERSFTKLSNDKQSMVGEFPEDFDLYYVGIYDDNTGKIEPLDTPQHISKAIQHVAQPTL